MSQVQRLRRKFEAISLMQQQPPTFTASLTRRKKTKNDSRYICDIRNSLKDYVNDEDWAQGAVEQIVVSNRYDIDGTINKDFLRVNKTKLKIYNFNRGLDKTNLLSIYTERKNGTFKMYKTSSNVKWR